ncbi:MAG: ferredoxin [Actinomycetota bacterium]|nr:ferredoxin [Actinomycetota bacterium]
MNSPGTETFRLVARSEYCAGSGGCKAVAPQLFDLDENGWVKVLQPEPSVSELDAALEAHDACPLGLIDAVDGDGESLG